jgi:hypothetical protein
VKTFFDENELQWSKLIGVCTDGAPAMLGIHSDFQTLMKEFAPFALSTVILWQFKLFHLIYWTHLLM